jgi:hypothetical protein
MVKEPKGLVYDLETSNLLALTFSLYPESISHGNIIEDWRIHCASWKWAGGEKVTTVVEKSRDDFEVCRRLREDMLKADFLITHNGIKFDNKKLNIRFRHHGLGPIPPIPTVDTLKEARASMAFTSNRLDYIGQYLDVGRKLHNSPGLWRDAFFGKKEALKEMATYNVQDVLLLEDVYMELRSYMKTHPNFNVIMGTDDNCRVCGSTNLVKRGYNITKTTKKQRYQCTDCGAWNEGKSSLHTAEIR